MTQIMTQDKFNNELLSAAEEGNLEKVKEALRNGAHINAMRKTGATALLTSAKLGNLEIVKFLVEQGAYFKGISIVFGTPLIQAAENGHIKIVKYLVEQGVNIEAYSERTVSALESAVRKSHIEIIKYLVEQGANKEKALICASVRGKIEIVKYLVEQGANKEEALIYASREGQIEVVKYLVEQGANIEAYSSHGTALMSASDGGAIEVIEYLLEQGASLNKEGLDWSILINYVKERSSFIANDVVSSILNIEYDDLELLLDLSQSSLKVLLEKSYALLQGIEPEFPEIPTAIALHKITADVNRMSILWTKAMFNSELQQTILKDLIQTKLIIEKLSIDHRYKEFLDKLNEFAFDFREKEALDKMCELLFNFRCKEDLDKMCELAFNFKEGQEDTIDSSPASLKLIAAQSALKKLFNKHELHTSEDIRKNPLSSLLKEYAAPFKKTKLGHEIDVLASCDPDCEAEPYMIEGYYDVVHKMLGDHAQTIECSA